ncbi:MAG: glycosyltransferase [Clostridiales bacterium]|nr:glycosyltransferase [Clostridiales bacterium]
MVVYIYGAGVYAKRCYEDVTRLGFSVKAFVVTDKADNPQELFLLPVLCVDDLSLLADDVLIVALKEAFREDVAEILKKRNVKNVYYYPDVTRLDVATAMWMNRIVAESSGYKRVYVYGAGAYGQLCLRAFAQRNVKVDGFLVTDKAGNQELLNDIPVFALKDFNVPSKETLIVVALKPKYRDEVLPLLRAAGYSNYICFKDEILENEVAGQGTSENADNNGDVTGNKQEDDNIFASIWRRRHDFVIEPESFGCRYSIVEKQRKLQFPKKIKFSILTPLYNTQEDFLREMIASVLGQSYENWELCLSDGSDSAHSYVRDICEKIASKDNRIKYKKLDKNKGISENTNVCLGMATGDYVALLDHDDLLHPAALYEMMKVISNCDADFIYTDEATFNSPNLHEIIGTNFKPDFAPDYFYAVNYICHFTAFSKKLLDKIGNFNSEYDGAQDYDLFLRLTEKARCIKHIPKCLYYWRGSETSTSVNAASKSYTCIAGQKAVMAHFKRVGVNASVYLGHVENTYRVKYEIKDEPLISIIIPNYEHWESLKKCVESIIGFSTYKNYEIIVVENNSKSSETFAYYKELEGKTKVRIVTWEGKFNYSAINNFAVKYANGEYILLLNNDVEVITANWLEEMLMYAQRSDVGAVGAMLYYPSNKIQHAGVIVGLGGVAGHSHKQFNRDGTPGYARRKVVPQNLSAVTAACVMIPKKVFDEVGGLDEMFEVAFNDVDLCLRIRSAGYTVVWTPFAELYHYESETRGYEDTPEKQARADSEEYLFKERWQKFLAAGDPYYNKNLTLDYENFAIAGFHTLFHC